MKKLLALIILCSFVFPIFADDAKVMPKGVIRGTFVYTNTSADEEYDADGEAQDMDAISLQNLGMAVELGVTEQITAAVQWTPGYNFAGEVDDSDADLKGLNDLFVGAKIQILGNQGFVKDDMMRVAMAPGIVFPLETVDGNDEVANALAGDDFKTGTNSKEAIGIGSRFYFDYNVTPEFFVNLYSEYIYYLPVEKTTFAAAYAAALSASEADDSEYEYGYKLTMEVEPQYTYPLGDLGSVSCGLPITYTMTPEYDVEGTTIEDSDTTLLQVKPWVSFFTTKTGAPMSFKVAYYVPVMGESSKKTSTLLLQARIYAKLF